MAQVNIIGMNIIIRVRNRTKIKAMSDFPKRYRLCFDVNGETFKVTPIVIAAYCSLLLRTAFPLVSFSLAMILSAHDAMQSNM